MKHTVIDLFCGAGGLSLGFHKAGFHSLYALEFNEIYAESYKLNFPNTYIDVADIREITNEMIKEKFKNMFIDVVIGGPPCQGFSKAGKIGRMFLEDERNKLFLEYLRFVSILRPRMFLIENVAALVTHNKGKTMDEIISAIHKIGYQVKYKILNSVNFGVPQERRRVFIVAYDATVHDFFFPKSKKQIVTIKDAIDDLPKLKSGETSSIDLHYAMKHTEQMLKKMSYVKDGGNRMDIPEEIRPKTGDIRKYIRYDSTKPSVCVTGDMRKIFHYSQNRALTCRELARIQTFPDDYRFCGSSIAIQQQIGNAVPPDLAYEVAKCFLRSLENE